MQEQRRIRWQIGLLSAITGVALTAPLFAADLGNQGVAQSKVVASKTVSQRVVASGGTGDPAGRTYYTVIMGTGDTITELVSDCVSFSATEICTSDGSCGTWLPVAGEDRRAGFALSLELIDEDGVRFEVSGHGRVDSKGPRSSLGGAARASADGVTLNFSLAGRSVRREHCLRLLEIDGI